MQALKICLWIVGVWCLLAVVALFLPMSTLESWVQIFGEEPIPTSPAVAYGVRGFAATYMAVGVFCILLALRPMEYGPMVPFLAIAAFFVGVVCGVAGVVSGVPMFWFLCDFISCTLVGVVILALWRRAMEAQRRGTGGQPQQG